MAEAYALATRLHKADINLRRMRTGDSIELARKADGRLVQMGEIGECIRDRAYLCSQRHTDVHRIKRQ